MFGVGPVADSALASELVQQSPVRMLTTWFNGTFDLTWRRYWRSSLIPANHEAGFAQHLVTFDETSGSGTHDTAYGPACGLSWPISAQFREDMEELADLWVGDGPLYVTMFSEFQTYPCQHNQWKGAENYYAALKDNFRAGAASFRRVAEERGIEVYVSFGPWGGWQYRWADPSVGGGRSLFGYFDDVTRESDFQSFQAMASEPGRNPTKALEMTRVLAPYGPVMLAHYKPDNRSGDTWDADIEQFFTAEHVAAMTDAGLFAFSFMDTELLRDNDGRNAAAVAAVERHAAAWKVPRSISGSPPPQPPPEPEPEPEPEPAPKEPEGSNGNGSGGSGAAGGSGSKGSGNGSSDASKSDSSEASSSSGSSGSGGSEGSSSSKPAGSTSSGSAASGTPSSSFDEPNEPAPDHEGPSEDDLGATGEPDRSGLRMQLRQVSAGAPPSIEERGSDERLDDLASDEVVLPAQDDRNLPLELIVGAGLMVGLATMNTLQVRGRRFSG